MSNTETAIPWNERKTVRPREIVELTGLSLSTIYKALHSGKLAAKKVGPRSWVIKPADVDAWLEADGGRA